MVFRRFYDTALAQASYLIGCGGECAIIDPNRDLEQYLQAAAEERMQIRAVTETHIHADYLSGSRELAQITGANLYLSDEGGPDWQYAFRDELNVIRLRCGDHIQVGRARIEALHTPGHTPEHLAFVITDEANSTEPLGVVSGDCLFVGEVGRPDLLETAAGVQNSREPGARDLFRSLSLFGRLKDHALVWPGHGAGSSCGKSLGGLPVSSLGYERLTNWALKVSNETSFVSEVLSGQPDPPRYFAQMKRLNRQGPPALGAKPMPQRRMDLGFSDGSMKTCQVVDVRSAPAFASGHIPGTISIPVGKGFVSYAGNVLSYDSEIGLIAESEAQAFEAAKQLRLIGLDQVSAWYGADVLRAYDRSYGPLATLKSTTMSEALAMTDAVILDVRNGNEWNLGHVPGAVHIPLGYVSDRAADLPKGKRIAVHCQAGSRSPIAVSLLEREGFTDLVDVVDGYEAYVPAVTSSPSQRT